MANEISIADVKVLDAAVIEQLRKRESDYYGGVNLFVSDPWATGGQNYETVLEVSNKFDLKMGGTTSQIESEYNPAYKAIEEMEYRITRSLVSRINTLSSLTRHGGTYTTGWDGENFGLVFVANPVNVEEIMSSQNDDKTRKGFYTDAASKVSRLRNAIQLLKKVDFGRGHPVDIRLMELAAEALQPCGIESKELDLAIRSFLPDRIKAKAFVYGPSGIGSNKGALNDLIEQLNVLQGQSANVTGTDSIAETSVPYVAYAGSLYELVDDSTDVEPAQYVAYAGTFYERVAADDESAGMLREAYHLPKKMKGVSKCRARDRDPNLPEKDQIWCVYDFKGRLKKRCKTDLEARRHKVWLVRNHWINGKGRNSPMRPKNTFRKNPFRKKIKTKQHKSK